ncbi:UNKNOWN [Stylonychia lemnae]|uniref:Uncharacterized protein n=1 Tax=Stylonychia lemnae TaxID=5949 RepID=A0A078ATF5_STYLE|nr:UNKNOWN [Stylonychia lemnae]|eukprot:CDW85725.1 UNKNOWN [Stylonychia lemnae]
MLFIYLYSQIDARGKTYDDLDDILKHDGLNSTKTHVAYKEPMDQGARIDPNKVVHIKPKVQEEKAVTSGIVIPKAYTASNPSARKSTNQTQQYEKYAKREDAYEKSDSLPLKYLKIPKRDRDAQFYFFLSTLLLLATTVTIISSCGCLFYFFLKNLIGLQSRSEDEYSPRQGALQQRYQNQDNEQQREVDGPQRNNNNYQQFVDEAQVQRNDSQLSGNGQNRLRNVLNYRDPTNQDQEIK